MEARGHHGGKACTPQSSPSPEATSTYGRACLRIRTPSLGRTGPSLPQDTLAGEDKLRPEFSRWTLCRWHCHHNFCCQGDTPPFQGGNSRGCMSPQIEVQRSPLRGPSASSEGSPGGSSSGQRKMTRSSSVWEKSALCQGADQEGVPQRCRSSVG